MSWVTPRTWTDGTVPTSSQLNEVRDSLNASEAAVVTTAGDIVLGTGANAVARFAKGTTAQYLYSATSGPQWASAPSTRIGGGPVYATLTNTSIASEGSSADTAWGSAISLSTLKGASQSVMVTVNGYVAMTASTDQDAWVDMKLTTTTGSVLRGEIEVRCSATGDEQTVALTHLFNGYRLAAGNNLQILCGSDSTGATFTAGRVSAWQVIR